MITITEIQPHYITGKERSIKGYTVYFKYEKKRPNSDEIRLDGSVFIASEKPVIDLNNMIARIKNDLGL